MAKALENIQLELAEYLIEESRDEKICRGKSAVDKLPKKLREFAYDHFSLSSDEISDYVALMRMSEAERRERAERSRELLEQFDQGSASDRKKVYAAFAPQLAEWMEAAWQMQKAHPYISGYARRPFRAPQSPAASLDRRGAWLRSFVGEVSRVKPEHLTLPWLARWAQHAFEYRADCVVPVLIAAMDAGGPIGNEVFDILYNTVTREDAIGVMADHVIQSLLGANRREGWELIEKTLLAAQRQEGLRSALLGQADCAHPEAFVRLLRLVLDHDLLRFSSVALSVNQWLGLLWDSASATVLRSNVESILKFVESEQERQRGLKSDDAETVFRALWASAFHDAPATVSTATTLLKHRDSDIRFAAAWLLAWLGLEEAQYASTVALSDDDLQVALIASIGATGMMIPADYHVDMGGGSTQDDDRFERLEKLYERLPEKPQKLAAKIWPWTERKIERSMLAGPLLATLGKRAPTRMLPYLKGLDAGLHQSVIALLAAQKKWDSLTRSTLLELVGHASADVRRAAFDALEGKSLQCAESEVIEGFLTRKSSDVRNNVLSLLINGTDQEAIASAGRLLAKRDARQRVAGLELLRHLADTNRSRNDCQRIAEEYCAASKKLSKEEETQLTALRAANRPTVTLADGLGFLNPQGRSPLVKPKAKKVIAITKPALACLASLDDLVHEHSRTIVTVKGWRQVEQKPLGEISYGVPSISLDKPIQPQLDQFPLYDVWRAWREKRPAKLRDKDGFELLRAIVAVELMESWSFDDLLESVKKPDRKKMAVAILGELDFPQLRFPSMVSRILDMLFYTEIPSGCFDYLLDCTENTYAQVPESMMQLLVSAKKPATHRNFWEDGNQDWRDELIFKQWPETLFSFAERSELQLTATQRQRAWQILRFHDEPCAGAPRRRCELPAICVAYRDKLATFDDIVDCVIGPDREGYVEFSELSALTQRIPSPEYRTQLEAIPELREFVDRLRDRVFQIELQRGEAPTAATKPALAIACLYGADYLFRALEVLNQEQFKGSHSWRSESNESRIATLTHLIRVTHPTDQDTLDDFENRGKTARAEGYCDDDRLLQLAFLAPQWSKLIGQVLGWNGFSEGLYWFLAHMHTWYGSNKEAAATAEGIECEDVEENPVATDVTLNSTDEQQEDLQQPGEDQPEPRKLTPWERLLVERTPLTTEDRAAGAVDVEWFHRTWNELGEKRWKQLAQAARFAANAAQAKKAQFLADVLLGVTPREELIDAIQNKYRKEHVRLLGLLPLASGVKRDTDVMERYEVLQSYKSYARKLSSLTKPSALQAVETGMSNLARLAGYADPLRMEWALESESLKDLVQGSVEIIKDGVTVGLAIDDDCRPKLTVRRGDKTLKAVPAPLKKKHAEIAALVDRAADLKKKSTRTRQSLEAAMCRGDLITAAEVVQLCEHPLVGNQLKRLVLIGEGIAGYPDKGGKALRDYSGTLEPIKKREQLRIAHPHDLLTRGDWDKWQQECFRAERIQPFKQIFRELYVITQQEMQDQLESHRFAGQQINPRQAMALWNAREWHTQEGVMKVFHHDGIIAEVTFLYDRGTPAEVEGLTLETIRFRLRDDCASLKLASVPARLFSESMRDIDLVVSVAHRGEVDPEASASTIEMRAALIRETCQLLNLANVEIKQNHAIIQGTHGVYSLHLGSGGIQLLPGGALVILPVHSQHRGRLFLPFADDDPRTAEVISKVLLLARDEEIQDPTILDQLGHAVRRQGPSSKTGKREEDRPSTKRRFEYQDGKSHKFWEIEHTGNSVTITWGRIGAKGQTKTNQYDDGTAAATVVERLIKEKLSKGYSEQSD